jgi:DNA-binding CsgD family transcriptional regulator
MDGYLQQHRTGPAAAKIPRLSPREREVVQLLGEGKTTKDVAVMLNVTVKTAETHRSNIMLKLKLHSIAELVLYAVRNEIVHVQLPAVLRFPSPGMAEPTLPLKPITQSFVCLDSAGR